MNAAQTNQPWRALRVQLPDTHRAREGEMEAHPCHDGHEEVEDALPVLFHVCFGQFNADGEDANREDDAGKLKRDRVHGLLMSAAPAARVEDVCAVRTCPYAGDEYTTLAKR
jgi:hypothetical protein